jgi:glucosamine-6-phosphate deaminase
MRLLILNDTDHVAEWAAKYVAKRIRDYKTGPDRYFTLGLPTGKYHSHAQASSLESVTGL